ncbi:MAG: hypothetical protein JEY99_10020 [Spirochaetales bacterium]|nr:hypothetical protein [Spirochaetales bacterium]
MKIINKSATITILLLVLLLASCPETGGPGTDPGDDNGGTETTIDSFFWGRWIAVDSDTEWYISRDKVLAGTFEHTVYQADAESIDISFGTIERDSDNMLRYLDDTYFDDSEEDPIPAFLYRLSGADNTFTASVVDSGDTNPSISRALGLVGIGGINVIIKNIDNDGDSQETSTDDEGVLTATETILGDNYKITIPVQTGVADELSAEVTPLYNGQDLGLFDLLNSGANFKMNLEANTWTGSFLADNVTEYDLWVEVENIGKSDMDEANYRITPLNGLVITECEGVAVDSESVAGILGSVLIGGRESLRLKVLCPGIDTESQDMELKVEVWSPMVEDRIWIETLSLRFFSYSEDNTITLNISTDSNSHDIKGLAINPDGIPYRVGLGENDLSWETGSWILIMSKDNNNPGLSYGVGFDTAAPDMAGFTGINDGEPDNTLEDSSILNSGETVRRYMDIRDVDFFTFTLGEL